MEINTVSYDTIIIEEAKLAGKDWRYPPDIETAWRIVCMLEEVMKNAFVVRVCSRTPYQRRNYAMIPETDAAHVNLMRKLVDFQLSYVYGPELAREHIPGGYSYREIVEAITRHDLYENISGDSADNENRDEAKKIEQDINCWSSYSKLAPQSEADFERRVNKLLLEMVHQSSELGRVLYCADKVSAILTCLFLDRHSTVFSPKYYRASRYVTKHDREEMNICERVEDNYCRASEMWTVDFLKLRRRVEYDDTGFFTAIIVMYTLIVNKSWYEWRFRDYEEAKQE